MKLFVGLGNPGKQYDKTRHNIGFFAADMFKDKLAGGTWQHKKNYSVGVYKQWVIFLPLEMMNLSGRTLASFLRNSSNFAQIYVAFDDLDLELGTYKISTKAPKIHNGINSITAENIQFTKIRIGIDSRAGARSQSGSSYVLTKMNSSELELAKTAISQMLEELMQLPE